MVITNIDQLMEYIKFSSKIWYDPMKLDEDYKPAIIVEIPLCKLKNVINVYTSYKCDKVAKSTRIGSKAGIEFIAGSTGIGSYQTEKGDKLYNRAYMINKIKEAYKKGYIDGQIEGK